MLLILNGEMSDVANPEPSVKDVIYSSTQDQPLQCNGYILMAQLETKGHGVMCHPFYTQLNQL